MASTSASASTKKNDKQKSKRQMMATDNSPDVLRASLDDNEYIVNSVVDYFKTFESRVEINENLILGFNVILRKVELSDRFLSCVLMNLDTNPHLLKQLDRSCRSRETPCIGVHNFDKIVDVLKNKVKGLKPCITGIGFSTKCDETFLKSLIAKMPIGDMRVAPENVKKRRSPSPPRPQVHCKEFYTSASDAPSRKLETGFGNSIVLRENLVPFLQYETLTASERPLELASGTAAETTIQPSYEAPKKASKYKKLRINTR